MNLIFSQMFLYFRRSLLFALPLAAIGLTGCVTTDNPGVYKKPSEYIGSDSVPRLHIGDDITVTLDGPPEQIMPHEEIIKEDGMITLPDIGPVKAAGRTTGELQADIHAKYVPAYYTRLNVTVKTGDRVFYVRGEVKGPGRQVYTGPITVTKAITSAGDFTDFSNRRYVVLTRANGERYVIDCVEILDGKKPDPDVFPGDQIEVKHRNL